MSKHRSLLGEREIELVFSLFFEAEQPEYTPLQTFFEQCLFLHDLLHLALVVSFLEAQRQERRHRAVTQVELVLHGLD